MALREHELKNDYIGEYKGRTPGANTLAYYPLVSDALDHSGNGRTLTNTGTKATIGYTFTDTSMVSGGFSNCVFVSAWIKNVSFSGSTSANISLENPVMGYYMYNTVYGNKFFLVYPSDSRIRVNGPSSPTNWHHICFGYDGTKSIYAIDGVVQTIGNGRGKNANNDVYLFRKDAGVTANVNISEAIFESVCWTAQEIQDYYNNTKSNYIEEQTYTIAQFSDSTSIGTPKFTPIYKSGYKITKIQIEGGGNITSSGGTFPGIQVNGDGSNTYLVFHLNPPYQSVSRLTSMLNGQTQSDITFNFTATTYTYKILFTIDKIEITINNTTYSWNNSTNMQSIITAIFNGQSPYGRQGALQGTANDTVFTVTYEKI